MKKFVAFYYSIPEFEIGWQDDCQESYAKTIESQFIGLYGCNITTILPYNSICTQYYQS